MSIYKKCQDYIFGSKKTENNTESYVGSLELRLTQDLDIDILCLIPDIEGKTQEEMILSAEEYAKFLVYLTQGDLLKNEIHKFLLDRSQKTRDPEYKLLLDNIMVFWSILSKEYKKKLKNNIKDDMPLIRPISVFSNN